jgi:hypothetical protein
LVPSQAAWTAFLKAAARADISVDDSLYDAIFKSLVAVNQWGTDVAKILAGETGGWLSNNRVRDRMVGGD